MAANLSLTQLVTLVKLLGIHVIEIKIIRINAVSLIVFFFITRLLMY